MKPQLLFVISGRKGKWCDMVGNAGEQVDVLLLAEDLSLVGLFGDKKENEDGDEHYSLI